MALPNPYYIDAEARHRASVLRVLSHATVEGQEGILTHEALSVEALGTPGAAILVSPGPYAITARHVGGAYESYIGKINVAEQVSVNPTSAGAARTDLVIARVENPYVVESTSWTQPPDPLEGPYAHIRVIEGVPTNINHVWGWNDDWSAITLAKITRPASTGIVTQAHITDLRSFASLREQRIIIITSPPPTPPPIAYGYWTESTPIGNGDQLLMSETSFTDFPNQATWQVPIPTWARGMDVNVLLNPQVTDGHVYGEMRLVVEGQSTGATPTQFDYNATGSGNEARDVIMIGGTETLQQPWCGNVVTMKLQGRSLDAGNPGKLVCKTGTRVNVFINFKRNPTYSDGS